MAVLGILVDVGPITHPGLEVLSELAQKIHFNGEKTELTEGFDPTCLIPGNTTEDKFKIHKGLTSCAISEEPKFLYTFVVKFRKRNDRFCT